MKQRIYLDNNSSTAVDPKVAELIYQDLCTGVGNPSSLHSFGQEARNKIAKARHVIASYLSTKPQEIIFTSGATEGLNMAIRGELAKHSQGHIITSNVEHAAVFATLKEYEAHGFQVTYLPAGLYGAITPEAVNQALRSDTKLIVLMAVNNETGVKTDIHTIANLAKMHTIPFVVDAVALCGKEAFSIPQGVTSMCFSGHKFHAPKGIGFNFLRSGQKLVPYVTGGEQEAGRRGGTENISGIIGLGEAISLLCDVLPDATRRMEKLRDKLEAELKAELGSFLSVNGEGPRICNTSNLVFQGVEGETLLALLDMEGVAVSHGSACASGALEPSRILLNMGIGTDFARSSIRISLSRLTTEEEIDRSIAIICKVVKSIKR